jgi:hypothetical protein
MFDDFEDLEIPTFEPRFGQPETSFYDEMNHEIEGILKDQAKTKDEALSPEAREILDEEAMVMSGAVPVWEVDIDVNLMIQARQESELEEIKNSLKHESYNVYGEHGIKAPYLEPTWFAFREDTMDDILEKAGTSLDKPLFERLNIRPVIVSDAGDKEKIFLARFEFPKYGAGLQYPEADLGTKEKCLAWIDFLAGMHYGCCEMLMVVGEVTTKPENFPSQDGEKGPVPPVPDEVFDERFTENKTLHNYIWLESDNAEGLMDGVGGEAEPANPHWFFRVNCIGKQKWPYPGEFVGLGNRIFPNLPWSISPDEPKFHPFLFSGMFMDTVFITSGHVLEVENTADGFCKVRVKWREKEIWAYPTDFAQYAEGDRVTIMKNITATKTSELWKDEDLWSFDEDVWRVAPITYYGKGFGW